METKPSEENRQFNWSANYVIGGPENRQPIFVLGTTRSGTTLLSLILGHHSEIIYVGELQWVFDFSGADDPECMDEYYAWLDKNRFFQVHRPNTDRSLTFPDLARSFLHHMTECVADSEPFLTASLHRHFRRTLELWPDAKVLHLVRDGRDVAASWMRLGWHGNTWSAAREWVALLDEWHALKTNLKNDQFFELRLEDLIDRPEDLVKDICRFLGVTYQPSMLKYHKRTTYAPITKSRSQRWRQDLSVYEVRIFEAIAGSQLDKYAYPRSGEPGIRIPNYMNLALLAQHKFRCTRSRIREFGLRLWFMELVTRRTGMEKAHKKALDEMHEITNSKLE